MRTRLIAIAAVAIFVSVSVMHPRVVAQGPEQLAVVRAVAPVFPVPEKGGYAVGSVIVEIKVNAAGVVTTARAVQGHPFLYHAAENAAKRWLFASSVGEPGTRPVRLKFTFKIMDDETSEADLSPVYTPPFQFEVRPHRAGNSATPNSAPQLTYSAPLFRF
ncbi:MAG: energy transducer TonB [Pyrinomonadaceae bacterium]